MSAEQPSDTVDAIDGGDPTDTGHGRRRAVPPIPPVPPRSAPRRVLGVLGRIVAWAVVAVSVLALLALVIIPRVSGSTPYTVLTGSMSPLMPPGTMVVVKPTEFERIRVGDVVTYQIASGRPEVVTHRVIGIDITDDGPRLRTQGDANPAADANGVRPEQVRGTVWYWVPLVGYVTTVGDGDSRLLITQIIGGALLLYALVVVIREVAKRRRPAPAGDTSE